MSGVRYCALLDQLLTAGKWHEGLLMEEIESILMEELDQCWWKLTKAEQDEVDSK